MEIVPAVKKLNSISRERLNFRRRPILCTTFYSKRATSAAHLTNFSIEFFYAIFTQDNPLLFYIMVQKCQKMTKNSIQGVLPQCSISSDCSIFADDTSVYNTGSKPPSICSMLSKDLNYAADWAAEWGMLFNAEKSEHLAISTRKPDITSPHVTMNGTQIPQVTSHKHLGVNFNNTLSWQQHVDKVYTSCARRIGMIRRLRRKLHPVVLKRIYLGAVLPKLEYACPVWCGGPTQKLIKMHANFCRRNGTALPSLQTRFNYHTLVMFYKIHTKQAPSYLTSLLPPLSSRSGYTFRKLSYRFPTVSRTSTLNSFLPRAVALWNALPTNVQQASSIYTFKKLLQSHLKI